MSADTPRTAAELGLMRGSPPPRDKRVTFSTLPRALDREIWADQVAALDAIAAAL